MDPARVTVDLLLVPVYALIDLYDHFVAVLSVNLAFATFGRSEPPPRLGH